MIRSAFGNLSLRMAATGTRRYWRDAATLILTAPTTDNHTPPPHHDQANGSSNYGVLLLQRNSEARFMPGAYVFPGGTVSQEDFTDQWCPLYEQLTGETMEDIAHDLMIRASGHRPPITHGDTGTRITKDIGLRIGAIRETFEESGVLLALTADEFSSCKKHKTHANICGSVSGDVLLKYQELVRRDAGRFLTLCQEMKVMPDIWGLYEWSNWLTPVTRQVKGPSEKPRRFDTIFYICGLNDIPSINLDNQEIVGSMWLDPQAFLSRPRDFASILRGPQQYELAKLGNFQSGYELIEFSQERERLGVEQWLGCVILCQDGPVLVLPGDDLYPKDPDYEGTREMLTDSRSQEELLRATQNYHRTVIGRSYRCNIQLNLGYPTPCRPKPQNDKPSKL